MSISASEQDPSANKGRRPGGRRGECGSRCGALNTTSVSTSLSQGSVFSPVFGTLPVLSAFSLLSGKGGHAADPLVGFVNI